MGIQCRIIRNKEGKVSYVEAPNGNRSKLYDDAVASVGEESALDIVLTAYTPSFTEEVKNPKIAEYRRRLVDRINSIPSTSGNISIKVNGIDQVLNTNTIQMVTEDLGNGETLLTFKADIGTMSERMGRTVPTAPNGKPSNLTLAQWQQVRTPEFMEWSNNWKDVIKDKNGEPLVHYHGTNKTFTVFNSGKGVEFFTPDKGEASRYTTSKGNMMELFVKTEKHLDASEEIPPFLEKFLNDNIDDLYEYLDDMYAPSVLDNENDEMLELAEDLDVEWTKLSNIDKVKFVFKYSTSDWQILEYPYLMDTLQNNGYTSFATHEGEGNIRVFTSNQAKSATDNVGTFDSTNPDIRFSEALIYTGNFVDSKALLDKYGQVHPNAHATHSTIEFRPKSIEGLSIGEQMDLKITGRLTTDKVDVLLVDNPLSKNKNPHITLSTAEGIAAKESNTEIENNLDKVEPLNDTVSSTVGTFTGKPRNTASTPETLLQGLADRLKSSGLAKEVNIVSEAEIKKALEKKGHKYRQGINGFALDDVIYINKDRARLDTPIHEFGHLWNSWMQENAPQVFKRGIDLIKSQGQDYVDLVKRTQPNLKGDAIFEEALAQAIGDNGARLISETQKESFIQWLRDAWNAIKGALGLANTSLEEFQNLSLDEFARRAATDLMSGKALSDLMNSQAGTVGEAFTVRPDAPLQVSKAIDRFKYEVDFTTELPRKTMQEVIEEYEGRIFFVTSDATGTGYDSQGDPILGGIGFMSIKENVDGKVGFASLDEATVIKTLPKITKRFGFNEKVAVMVMVQNADATVGNYYGAKYFGRGLRLLKEQSPNTYEDIVQSVENFIDTRAGVRNEFKDKYKNGELVKKSTHDAFIDLLRNVEKYSEVEFAQEFIKDTTFDARRTLLQGLLIDNSDTRTDSSTPLVKSALKDLGFTQLDFLKEYGDNTIFTEDMYRNNEGGFIAGGFEFTSPATSEALKTLIKETQNKGVTHPQFNGKVPTTGENFFLDGLYPVNENFVEFAKQQNEIDYTNITREEVDTLVRASFKKETDYQPPYREGGKKFMPMGQRGYTQLSVANKTKLKNMVGKMDANNVKDRVPNIIADVARGSGFSPDSEAQRQGLVRKAATEPLVRFSIGNSDFTSELNRISNAPRAEQTGATFNTNGTVYNSGGLVVPLSSMNIIQNKLTPQVVERFVKDNSSKISNEEVYKVGLYKFPNSNNVSLDLSIVVNPAFRKTALEFGKRSGQESLFDLDTFENIKTGADGTNPAKYTDEEMRIIGAALSEGRMPEFLLGENRTGQTQGFFSDVVTGKSDKFKAKKEWTPILPFTGLELKFKQVYDKFKGNFDNHIATSIPTFRETQIKVGSAIRSLLAPAPTVFNEELNDIKDEYVSDKNLEQKDPLYTAIDDSLFTEIAEHHANVKDDRQNPTMVKSYRAFLNETKEQYQYLIDAGYTIEPWMEAGEPYGVDSQAVRDDVINNKHLYYLRSKSATGDNSDTDTAENYMPFESSGITINGDDVLMNDLFRAVHDIFGHVSANNSFSPQGELNAYKTHSVMYSDTAQKALFLETVVYNAAYRETGNYAPRKIYNIPNKFIEGINRKPLVYDIGGSEGGFVKAITEQSNGVVESINLDLNSDMQTAHNKKPVEGSEFVLEAFYEGYTDDTTGVTYKRHRPEKKADVVHESMVFQFISPKRKEFIKEVKKNYLREDGIALFEEKLSTENEAVWLENERVKNTYKSMYYSQEELTQKQEEVLVGMKDNQTFREEFMKNLKDEFTYVEEYWDSGNFKGYLATDSKAKRDGFLAKIGGRITSDYSENKSKPQFSIGFMQTKATPQGEQVILSNVDDQIQGQGVGTEMYKKAASSLAKEGKSLLSDFNSKGASGIWDKMRDEGVTEPVDVNGKVIERIKTTPDSFDFNGEPNVNDVIQFIQSKNFQGQTLSEVEVNEVRNTLLGTTLNNSEELFRALQRAFTPKGVYSPSERTLVDSGLYSKVEARRLLDSEELQLKAYEMMHKIKNSDSIAKDADIESTYITVTPQYNSLGVLKKANPYINQKIARDVLGGIKDETSFYNQSEANDLEFANNKFTELSSLTRLVKSKLDGSPETNLDNLKTRLEETLTLPTSRKVIDNLNYLLDIPNNVWNIEFQNVRTILNEVEKNSIDIGLDLTDLNEEAYDKTPAEVKSLLNAVRNFAVLQNETTFDILFDEYVTFFNISENPTTVTMNISEDTSGKSLVYLDTKENSYNLFSKYSLLPLGNNLYQKVNTNKSLDEVYDIVYQTLKSGKSILPTFNSEYDVTDSSNEEFVRQDIENYANRASKEVENNIEYDTDTLRKMVLFSAYFGTQLNNSKVVPSVADEVSIISNYPSNADYLRTEFISDFNKQMLKEKVKNSEKFNSFYKHFDISENGIELVNTDPITMREIQPYLTSDLINHFKLKKEGVNIEAVSEATNEAVNDVVLRNYYSNYPTALPLFTGTYQMDNNILVTSTNEDFIRVNEGVFEYVETVGKKSLYGIVPINDSNFKIYDANFRAPQLGEISKFNISQGVKADKKVNHLYSKAEGKNITNEIDNC